LLGGDAKGFRQNFLEKKRERKAKQGENATGREKTKIHKDWQEMLQGPGDRVAHQPSQKKDHNNTGKRGHARHYNGGIPANVGRFMPEGIPSYLKKNKGAEKGKGKAQEANACTAMRDHCPIGSGGRQQSVVARRVTQ